MRIWKSKQPDDGSIHCLGNGRIAAYEQGMDIIQVFGPPYSNSSEMSLKVSEDNEIEVKSERSAGTDIWTHSIYRSDTYIGEAVDFADSKVTGIVRKINLTQQVMFDFCFDVDVKVIVNAARYEGLKVKGALLACIEAGKFIYNRYPNPKMVFYQIIIAGDLSLIQRENNNFRLNCQPGESFIYIIGGSSYPDCIKNTEEIIRTSYEELLNRTMDFWKKFTNKRLDFKGLIPEKIPMRESLLQAIDDVSILIKSQQGIEGGVLAGHNYHLAYVRDQYGVSRGLIKLGYIQEAKAILEFYWRLWKRHGEIHNAQSIGIDGIFHIHENDEVEITGYLILQAFDYLSCSDDVAFIKEIFPMLEWAWDAQKRNLINYMLPFNGDETYVAGGILPRTCLNDGSAEATMLFVTGGKKLLQWISDYGLWGEERLLQAQELLEQVISHFRENFWGGDKLYTNNPQRLTEEEKPQYRHGVCEGCGGGVTWTEINKNGRYVCPKCMSLGIGEKAASQTYSLKSVSFTLLYIDSDLLTTEEISQLVSEVMEEYKNSGRLPSRPDGNITVGYDYGLLLYTMAVLKHPLAEEIYKLTLSRMDLTGAWVEYYEEEKPKGTRYRPWESGINIEALIEYAQRYNITP